MFNRKRLEPVQSSVNTCSRCRNLTLFVRVFSIGLNLYDGHDSNAEEILRGFQAVHKALRVASALFEVSILCIILFEDACVVTRIGCFDRVFFFSFFCWMVPTFFGRVTTLNSYLHDWTASSHVPFHLSTGQHRSLLLKSQSSSLY